MSPAARANSHTGASIVRMGCGRRKSPRSPSPCILRRNLGVWVQRVAARRSHRVQRASRATLQKHFADDEMIHPHVDLQAVELASNRCDPHRAIPRPDRFTHRVERLLRLRLTRTHRLPTPGNVKSSRRLAPMENLALRGLLSTQPSIPVTVGWVMDISGRTERCWSKRKRPRTNSPGAVPTQPSRYGRGRSSRVNVRRSPEHRAHRVADGGAGEDLRQPAGCVGDHAENETVQMRLTAERLWVLGAATDEERQPCGGKQERGNRPESRGHCRSAADSTSRAGTKRSSSAGVL